MGDCGLSQLVTSINSIDLVNYANEMRPLLVDKPNKIEIKIRRAQNWLATSFYVNLTSYVAVGDKVEPSEYRVTSATYEETNLIRTVSVLNKESLLLVLMYPIALQASANQTSSFEINLSCSLVNSTSSNFELNLIFTIDDNSNDSLVFDPSTTTPLISSSTTPVNQAEKKNMAYDYSKLDFSELKPKATNGNGKRREETVANDLESLRPVNIKFQSNLFKQTYESYFEYLEWSVRNEYLTNEGMIHKLKILKHKLDSELNLDELKARLSRMELKRTNSTNNGNEDDDDDQLLKMLFVDSDLTPFNLYDRELLFKRFVDMNSMHQHANDSTNSSKLYRLVVSFQKRRLLDTFADSLRHVNRLFNQIYGYMARKVPAHMPHMIDRDIMNTLQLKFKNEFEATSANRWRTSTDMQYAFSYYYFVISEPNELNATSLFREFDLNRNKRLDANEIRIVNLRLNAEPFSLTSSNTILLKSLNPANVDQVDRHKLYELKQELRDLIIECNRNGSRDEAHDKWIEMDVFVGCEPLFTYLKQGLWTKQKSSSSPSSSSTATASIEYDRLKNKYKYELYDEEETKFIMISGNAYDIEVKLNNLIREPVKFICLNDNIDLDERRFEARKLKFLLKYFYETMNPTKSSFE